MSGGIYIITNFELKCTIHQAAYHALRTSFLRKWTSGDKYFEASVRSHLISDSSGAGRMDAFCL
jgi:hypothetical protein